MMASIAGILDHSSVNGEGLRTVVFFAGCTVKCPGCHNKDYWDQSSGSLVAVTDLIERIKRNQCINDGVTFSGGDPFDQPDALLACLKACKEANIPTWVYTGRTFEMLFADAKTQCHLDYIDTLVDGPYLEALKDDALSFRGSSNQRLLRL